jgi:hypothetical protein
MGRNSIKNTRLLLEHAMSKAQTAKAEPIQTLNDWIARWPKLKTLGFDPETREATIYTDKTHTTVVRSIPWKREADIMTILTNPSQFSAQAVDAATSRMGKIREQDRQIRKAREEELRIAEGNLLDAWRTYNAASVADKATLRRDILSAEKTMNELELRMSHPGRVAFSDDKDVTRVYVGPMRVGRRGISVTGAASEA